MDKYKLIQDILYFEYAMQQLRGLALFQTKTPLTSVDDFKSFIDDMLAKNFNSRALAVAKEDFEQVVSFHKVLVKTAQINMDGVFLELKEYSNGLMNDDLKEVLAVLNEIPKLKPRPEIKENTPFSLAEVKEQAQIIRNNNRIK